MDFSYSNDSSYQEEEERRSKSEGRRDGLGQSVDFLTKLSTKLSGKSGLYF